MSEMINSLQGRSLPVLYPYCNSYMTAVALKHPLNHMYIYERVVEKSSEAGRSPAALFV